MTPEETQKMLLTYGSDDFSWKSSARDQTDFTPYMKKNSEFIAALDLIKNRTQMTDDPTASTLSASKSFRYEFNKQMDEQASWLEHPDPRTGVHGTLPKEDQSFGYGTHFDSNTGPGKLGLPEWFNATNEILFHQLSALFETRENAAAEQEVAAKMYNDYAKDLPPAQNYDELKAQLDLIQGYDDRTKAQKFYLQNKSAVRYIMKQAGDMGYGNDIWERLHETNWKKTHYMSSSAYKMKDIPDVPAWINKGEAGIPDWIELSNYRRGREDKSPEVYEEYIKQLQEQVGQDVDKIIEDNGKAFQKKYVPEVPTRNEISEGVSTIPFNNMVKTGKKTMVKYWSKRYRRMKAKADMLERMRLAHLLQIDEENESYIAKWHDRPEEEPFVDHKKDILGGDVTYQRFLDWIADPADSPEYRLGEPSMQHVYKALLNGVYSWAPKNLVLDEENLPDGYIIGHEEEYKPMLAALDPSLRQQADRLHNMVHTPQTQEYIQRYHTADRTNDEIAKDASGTTELFNDWALPYENGLHQVKFNGMLHTQMDFGVQELV